MQLARLHHWFKNVFMLLGAAIAAFFEPAAFTTLAFGWTLLVALLATCLIAASNYVLNEVLDADFDREHPVKRDRPMVAARALPAVAYVEWLVLGALGLSIGFAVNQPFFLTCVLFWIMGIVYNVPGIRTKDVPHLDVLSESVNNPIRLLLGWFPFIEHHLPPLSLILSYWAAGAFFMALKRLAELRSINDPEKAGRYRKSFRYYTDDRLLTATFFYVTASAFFGGIFLVRFRLELILLVPAVAGFFAFYVTLSLRKDSPAQTPEKLYQERGFCAYAVFCSALFVFLMFTDVPMLYEYFNFEYQLTPGLWQLGAP